MATNTLSNPAAVLGDAARFGEIRGRLLFLIGALIVYRIGTYIPVPGINPAEVARFGQGVDAVRRGGGGHEAAQGEAHAPHPAR